MGRDRLLDRCGRVVTDLWMGRDRLLDRCGRVVTDAVLLSRFSQIDTPPGVRIQISAQHQLNAKQQRMTRQMANRQLIVPSVSNIQQMQQVQYLFTKFPSVLSWVIFRMIIVRFASCSDIHSTYNTCI